LIRCACCDTPLEPKGSCALCDVTLSSPPHDCLRWQAVIGDEDGCEPKFMPLTQDHELIGRIDQEGRFHADWRYRT
jgi:hypothetical protein